VLGWLIFVVLLAVVLLVASALPNTTLVGRLLGAAGEQRAGTVTPELVAHLGERLRFAAGLLLVLSVGLTVLRAPFEDLIDAAVHDLTWPRWPARADALAVGAAALLAIGLRLAFLNQPMRYDEATTFNEFASRPLYYGLSFYPDPNNHLLNTLLVHFAFVGLGNQPWVLRLPALLAGVLLVPATYALARLLHDRRTAFLSAMFVAASSYLVEYSTNARGYMLQALCFVVLLSLIVIAVRRDGLSALFLAALVAALGAYAVPTMLYGVVVAGAWFWIQARRVRLSRIAPRHLAVSGLVLGLVVSLVYLPVLLVSGPDKLVANRFVAPLDLSELALELPTSLAHTWAVWNRDIALPISALLLLGFVITTVADVRRKTMPLGVLAATVCLAIALLQRVAPYERVWLFLLPLYFVLSSGGLVRLSQGRWPGLVVYAAGLVGAGVIAVTTFTSGSVLASPETGRFVDAEAVARTLSGRLAPGDAVLTLVPASQPELQYYFPRFGLPIDTLVRPPEEATRLYVVALPDTTPAVVGWDHPEPIQRFPGAVLLALQRAPG